MEQKERKDRKANDRGKKTICIAVHEQALLLCHNPVQPLLQELWVTGRTAGPQRSTANPGDNWPVFPDANCDLNGLWARISRVRG